MTLLKQQISPIPFSIEHRYSPYKRRRFENRSDQMFCILLIKDVLSRECKLPPTPKFETKSYPDLNSDFRINLALDVRRISVPKLWIHSSASFLSPRLVQIGCWLYENWANREMLTNVGKSPIPQWWRNEKPECCDNYRVSGALEKLEHETILQDRASDR